MEGVVVVVVVRKGLLRGLMLLKWGIRKSEKKILLSTLMCCLVEVLRVTIAGPFG